MAELELEGFAAEGVTEQLVPEADPENRLVRHELAQLLMDVSERGRIAGAVAEEHTFRLLREHFRGARGAGYHVHGKAFLPQAAQDVALHPEIIGHDPVP